MYSHKTEGVVLLSRNFGEADKIITLYTKAFGKLDALAKGARRTKSRFGSSLEPFTYLKLMIFHKTLDRLAIITGFDIISTNSELRGDLDTYTSATYIGEIVTRFHEGSEMNELIFNLLIKTLSVLLQQDMELVKMAFVLKFLAFSGYRLITTRCASCKKKAPFENIFFNAPQGGIICPVCSISHRDSIEISHFALEGLKSLELARLDELNDLDIMGPARDEIKLMINTCLNSHLGSELKTEKFSQQLADRSS